MNLRRFTWAIMEQGRGQILDTVAEIAERHEAVKAGGVTSIAQNPFS